ncbi:MAG: histidine phosphatase family protein [Patescibacteria group bacterium]
MKILIARHATTDWNLERRIQGQRDIPLNDRGRAVAAQLAEKVAVRGITLIVCSDLCRAVETAEIVAARTGARIRRDPRLRESCFGSLEGMTYEEIDRIPGAWSRDSLDFDFRKFGGECSIGVDLRQSECFDEIRVRESHERPLVIGHGRSLFTKLSSLFGTPTPIPPQGEFLEIDI